MAHPVPITADAGYFWFFEPDNTELAFKVLNGCGINGSYWVFGTGLTNLEVAVTVTDITTGQVRKYSNPQGNPFEPILDTAALETCSAATVTEMAGVHPEAPRFATSATRPAAPVTTPPLQAGCTEGDTVLCLDGRFKVEASWQTASGATGPAYAVPMTRNSGYLWFFEPSNVELIVKELNACSIEQGNWFFGAGMTDVGVDLTIKDTFTGESRTYSNPVGAPFLPIQDTGAFAFCPTPTPTPTPTFTPSPTRTRVAISTFTPTPSTFTPTPTGPPPAPTPTPPLAANVVVLRSSTTTKICDHNVPVCRDPIGCLLHPACIKTFTTFGPYFFSPNPIRIRAGGTVTWTWVGSHSTTSGANRIPDGNWDSGLQNGFTFSHRFDQAGTYPYYCLENHAHLGGTVLVEP